MRWKDDHEWCLKRLNKNLMRLRYMQCEE
jgi:hypothetical protein